MNNNTANATLDSISSVAAAELVQQAYLYYIYILSNISTFSLLVYNAVLALPHEMVYMWLSPKPFSVPNMFYAFTRYGSLISQGIMVWLILGNLPLGPCNVLADVDSAALVLTYVGVQGILIARAYALCEGNKVVIGTSAFFFMGGLILLLYCSVIFNGCFGSYSADYLLESIFSAICIVLTDVLVFCVCIWRVWGIWKLKREVGTQSRNDLVLVLVRQTISRFSFAIVFTITAAIVALFTDADSTGIISNFQRCFSGILLANFALDLRQQNSSIIQTTNMTLPSIQFQSVANYIHQSILAEMGDNQNTHAREGDDDLLGSQAQAPDVETQREEVNLVGSSSGQ